MYVSLAIQDITTHFIQIQLLFQSRTAGLTSSACTCPVTRTVERARRTLQSIVLSTVSAVRAVRVVSGVR